MTERLEHIFDESVLPAAKQQGTTGLREFILRDQEIRLASDPDAAVLAFLEDTYARVADLAGWPRSALEPAEYPSDGRPDRA